MMRISRRSMSGDLVFKTRENELTPSPTEPEYAVISADESKAWNAWCEQNIRRVMTELDEVFDAVDTCLEELERRSAEQDQEIEQLHDRVAKLERAASSPCRAQHGKECKSGGFRNYFSSEAQTCLETCQIAEQFVTLGLVPNYRISAVLGESIVNHQVINVPKVFNCHSVRITPSLLQRIEGNASEVPASI